MSRFGLRLVCTVECDTKLGLRSRKLTCVFVCLLVCGTFKDPLADSWYLSLAASWVSRDASQSHRVSSRLCQPTRSPACLPEINAKGGKKEGTRNKQQYNNRIFLGLISSASAQLQGRRLVCRCLLSIHYLASSGAAAARHSIKHSSSRRPKECHHQSASALNCQSAASPLSPEGLSHPFHAIRSFRLTFCLSPYRLLVRSVPPSPPFLACLMLPPSFLITSLFLRFWVFFLPFLPPNDYDCRKEHSDACLTKTHLSV